MSIPALQYAWELPLERPADKVVLLALAWHANAHGEGIRPSVERMTRMTALSRSTVIVVKRRLEHAGVIERTGTWGPKRFAEYRIPGVPEVEPPAGSQSETPKVQLPDPEGSSSRTSEGGGVQLPDPRDSAGSSSRTPEAVEGSSSRTPEAVEGSSSETPPSSEVQLPDPQGSSSRTPGVQLPDPEREEEREEGKKVKVKDKIKVNTYATEVVAAWNYWCERRQPNRRELEPSQARLIAKALKLVDVEELKQAIDGLLASEWHREHNRLQLSTILATRPGGPTLRDQVESFIERSSAAPSPAASNARSPLTQGRIDEEVRMVRGMWRERESWDERHEWERERFEQALEFLASQGITALDGPHAEVPRFEGLIRR